MKVNVILIRHGEREKKKDILDKHAPLTPEGEQSTGKIAEFLSELKLESIFILTSRWKHAQQTADLLANRLGIPLPMIVKVNALTPEKKYECSIEAVIKEAQIDSLIEHAKNRTYNCVIIFVGHEPRLTQLATMMTSMRFPPLDRLECLCIDADNLLQLRLGRGKLQWRCKSRGTKWPPRAVADTSKEELGPKLVSKMTVAALLAGFNFTALLELVKEPDKLHLEKIRWESLHFRNLPSWDALWWLTRIHEGQTFHLLSIGAIVSLTMSIGLFVIAIYIYDKLSMPEKLLDSKSIVPVLAFSKKINNRVERFGFVYAVMISTWQFVFTPAVLFAILGFLCIVARAWFPLSGAVFIVVVLIGVYYRLSKPRGPVD
jgi:phosphohistidine phosphatase SixA